MQMETDNKNVFQRIYGKLKSAAKFAGEILDPGAHNIDNPEGKKYYETEEYWKARAKDEKTVFKGAATTWKGEKHIDYD